MLCLSVVVCLLNVCAKILTKIRCRSRTESDHRGGRAEDWMQVCMNAIVSEYFYVTRENTDQVIFNCFTCCKTFKTLRKMKLMLNVFKTVGGAMTLQLEWFGILFADASRSQIFQRFTNKCALTVITKFFHDSFVICL